MGEFEELRARLSGLDREAGAARRAARGAALRASAAKGDRRLAEQARIAKERSDAVQRERRDAFAAFEVFSDPRREVERLADETPLLLLPIHLEIRFKTLMEQGEAAPRHELWVRIYPDDCSAGTFDPELSTAEVDAGIRFWRESWRAAGDDAEARAAWRGLAGAYGANRAAWIVKAFAPLDPAGRPTKLAATDLVLVISGSDLPPSGQRGPLAGYWSAVWKAGDDAEARGAARAELVAALGSQDAAGAAL